MKPEWIKSHGCLNRSVCFACRSNKTFTDNLSKDFIVPESWPKCPFGITADSLPEAKAVQTLLKNTKDICKYAIRDCCGKPFKCSIDDSDCPDRFNLECEKLKSADKKGKMLTERSRPIGRDKIPENLTSPKQKNLTASPRKNTGGCRGCKGRRIRK